jgi:hypothetical protein
MSDHLNSIHLELPRRDDFRRARAKLLDACGDQTRCVIHHPHEADKATDSRTFVQGPDEKIPTGTDYALMDKESVYPLKVGLNTIGRLPDNDVVIEDAFVSRRHCAILIHVNTGSELHDVASKNGTFLNGSKLTAPMQLHSGDEIRMCDRQLIFVCKSDSRNMAGHAATMSK